MTPIPAHLSATLGDRYAAHQAHLQSLDITPRHDPAGASPARIDLTSADLRDADLTGADLTSADLTSAKGIVSVGPVGAFRRLIYGVKHPKCIMIQAECHWGTMAETRAAVEARYADGTGREQHRAGYLAALTAIEAILTANP